MELDSLPLGLKPTDAVVLGGVLLLTLVWYLYQAAARSRVVQPAKVHSRNVKIARIRVYPIKSCAGFDLQESAYEAEGFAYDRKWMIVDLEKNKQLSARDDRGIKASPSQLVRVFPKVKKDPKARYGGTLSITFRDAPDLPPLDVPLDPSPDDVKDWEICKGFDLWGLDCEGYVVPSIPPSSHSTSHPTLSPSDVLSSFVGKPVKLVMKTPKPRPIASALEFDASTVDYKGGSVVRYPDFSPFLVASEASIEDAEKRVRGHAKEDSVWRTDSSKRLLIERFRPNVIVTGVMEPFGEDDWQEARVPGQGSFLLPNRCPRCMFPNVDTETGIRDKQMPNNAMMKYRKVDRMAPAKYCFGMYMVPVSSNGMLKVGDVVEVTKSAKNPRINE